MKRLVLDVPDTFDVDALLARPELQECLRSEVILPAYQVSWEIQYTKRQYIRGQGWVDAEDAEALRRLKSARPNYEFCLGEFEGHSEVYAGMAEITIAEEAQFPEGWTEPCLIEVLYCWLCQEVDDRPDDGRFAPLVAALLDEGSAEE